MPNEKVENDKIDGDKVENPKEESIEKFEENLLKDLDKPINAEMNINLELDDQ